MAGGDYTIEGIPGSQWVRGQVEWGCTLPISATDPGLPLVGGIGVVNVQRQLPTLVGEGPPRIYEVRFSLTQGDPVGPFGGDGLLKARVISGIGAARHLLECDLLHGTRILAPGGSIQVAIYQTGIIQHTFSAVSVSIAAALAGEGTATNSILCDGILFGAQMRAIVDIPPRSNRLVLQTDYTVGASSVNFNDQNGAVVAHYDIATDKDLTGRGVPVPRNSERITVLYPPGATRLPVACFLLDC